MRTLSILRRTLPLWLAVVVPSPLSPVIELAAQTSPPEETRDPTEAESPRTLQQEVAQLNRTLERIADLLASQVDTQQIDVGMKRLEMLTSRLERSERELRNLRSRRSSLETEKIALEEQRAQAELSLERGDVESVPEEARAFFRQMDRQLDRVREELAETDRQSVELENQVAAQRRDLQAWQDFVDRRLGGL